MNTPIRLALNLELLCLLSLTSGCVVFSLHSMRDVAVTLTDAESGRPAGRLPVKVVYSDTYYLPFLIVGPPDELRTETDEHGKAVTKLADYRFIMHLEAGGNVFPLTKKLVRDGGVVDGRLSHGNQRDAEPRLRLKLEPVARRPHTYRELPAAPLLRCGGSRA